MGSQNVYNIAPDPNPGYSPFHVGGWYYGGTGYTTFIGEIYSIKIYNRGLSFSEIQQNINTSNRSFIDTNGLFLYMDADAYPGSGNTWPDLSGNNYYGTMVNTPSFVRNDPSFFTFNVASTYWALTGITMPSDSITLMGWCRQDARPGPHQTVICTSRDYQYGLKLMSSYYGAVVAWLGNSDGTNAYTLDANTPIESDGLWHHLATTKNSTTGLLTIYVDGSLKNSATAFTGTTAFTGFGAVGTEYHSSIDYYYNGRISSVMIYNRDLSLTEIQQNFNLTKSRFGY